MGLFKKKPDPISERAQALNEQIAALEEQIRRLAEQETQSAPLPPPPQVPAPAPPSQTPAAPQPKLRSTARPLRHTSAAQTVPSPATPEPFFEDVSQNPFKGSAEAPNTPEHYNELGVRKYDLAAFWQRLKNNFRGPSTSNPKLVSYLAAGSIQGLRPLRYEKRVARNRFIGLVVLLILVMWGVIAMFVKR